MPVITSGKTRSILHLHRSQTDKIEVVGGQVQVAGAVQKKYTADTIIMDMNEAQVEKAIALIDVNAEILSHVAAGKTCSVVTVGANSTNMNNYPRLRVFTKILSEMQKQLSEVDANSLTKISIACLGLSENRAVDLISEKSLPLTILSTGLPECVFEPVDSVGKLLDKIQTGFSMPGLLISVRVERIPYRMLLSIGRDIEQNRNVYSSLVSGHSPSSCPSVGILNLLDFGSIRFSQERQAVSSMSEPFMHFFSLIKCHNDTSSPYRALLAGIVKSPMILIADLEAHHANAEVDSFLEFMDMLARHKSLSCPNYFDERIPMLYQMETKYKELKKKCDGLAEEQVAFQDICDRLKDKVESQREKIGSCNAALETAHDVYVSSQNTIVDLESKCNASNTQVADLQKEIKQLKTSHDKQLESHKQEVSKLRKEQKSISDREGSRAQQSEQRLEEYEDSIKQKDKELKKLTKLLDKLTAENVELTEKRGHNESQEIHKLVNENEELKTRLVKLESNLEKATDAEKNAIKKMKKAEESASKAKLERKEFEELARKAAIHKEKLNSDNIIARPAIKEVAEESFESGPDEDASPARPPKSKKKAAAEPKLAKKSKTSRGKENEAQPDLESDIKPRKRKLRESSSVPADETDEFDAPKSKAIETTKRPAIINPDAFKLLRANFTLPKLMKK